MTGDSAPNGILLVDKPQGPTSHDMVSRTRRLAGTRKVGHAGTLDPMATGLLVLGLGPSTRLLTYVVGVDKEYFATIRLGRATTTDDAEGEFLGEHVPTADVANDQLDHELTVLTGDIAQIPSAVSAIKVDGQRAYARVRAGEDVQLAPRQVTVSVFERIGEPRQTDDGYLDLDVRVECSSGTYIRALARDLGAALGVGGHLTVLRRTKVGPFEVADAVTLADTDPSSRMLQPSAAALKLFDSVSLTAEQTADLRNGKRVVGLGTGSSDLPVAALDPDGALIGLVTLHSGKARALMNFPPPSEAIES